MAITGREWPEPLPYPLREPQVLSAQSLTVRFCQKRTTDEIKSYPGKSKLVRKSSLEPRKRVRSQRREVTNGDGGAR
jgi:hypothetical protein